jgi:hypothetical protein
VGTALEAAGHVACADLGRRARVRIEQQLSMQVYLTRLDEIYERALHALALAQASANVSPAPNRWR